jgi:hypothetical protein
MDELLVLRKEVADLDARHIQLEKERERVTMEALSE